MEEICGRVVDPKKGEQLVYIRYFAVRDRGGKQLGTMEVTQDITRIEKTEGERMLRGWKD